MSAITRVASTATLFLLLSGLSFGFSHAQTLGLQVKPAIVEDNVVPGDVYHFSIKVTNLADEEKTVYLSARDITSIDEGGVPIFAEEGKSTPFELSQWITVPQSNLTLKPNQTVTVPFAVRIPRDASPGAHFGGVFFDARPSQVGTTGSAVGAMVGSIVSLRIAGDISEEMRLREFSTEHFIYDAPPVQFTARVDNLGNVLVRPQGVIEITDMFGSSVGSVKINENAAAVFPGSDREFNATWERSGLTIGRYQALLSFVYGEDGRKTVVRTTSFWVLPLKLTLTVLGGLALLIALLYFSIRMYIRKKLRAMGVDTRADANLYARKYNPVSRMTFIVFGLFIVCVIFILVLFVFFA